MKITLPKSLLVGLDRQYLRLIDVSCRANENKTYYFLQSQLMGYKTKLRRKGDFYVYTNMVSEIPIKENQIVTSKENGQTSGVGGGDYSREVNIIYIFFKG